jgi:ATP-dependent Lon protease
MSGRPVRAEHLLLEPADGKHAPAERDLARHRHVASHRAGITTIILPKENEADMEDIPEEVRNQLTFHCVSTLDEAFAIALMPAPNGTAAPTRPSLMEESEQATEVGAGT